LNEVDDTSIFKTARPIRYRRLLLQWPRSRPGYPRSGLSHSDFVLCALAQRFQRDAAFSCLLLGNQRRCGRFEPL